MGLCPQHTTFRLGCVGVLWKVSFHSTRGLLLQVPLRRDTTHCPIMLVLPTSLVDGYSVWLLNVTYILVCMTLPRGSRVTCARVTCIWAGARAYIPRSRYLQFQHTHTYLFLRGGYRCSWSVHLTHPHVSARTRALAAHTYLPHPF